MLKTGTKVRWNGLLLPGYGPLRQNIVPGVEGTITGFRYKQPHRNRVINIYWVMFDGQQEAMTMAEPDELTVV